MSLSRHDLDDLRRARAILENPGLAAKLSSTLGSPVEKGMKMLPSKWQKSVHQATEAALMKALDVAVSSLGQRRPLASSDRMHRFAAAASGAAGGAFGIAAIGIELPISTTVILRSIADIAAAEGEDPRHIETKLACLTVFALGSTRDRRDNAAESGYFAARSALATAVTEASRYLAEKGLSKSGAPALLRLISLIAARFGIVVSQKTAAQMVPVLGAAGGALINTLFIGHFQDMARGHFIVRRLEKVHGAEPVRQAY
ncbi:MAG TPA: EcsC family protein, partial [Myxococcota bacterium]|nr:EcsC family protein [Myxococcota bacterium]